jgi:hypothetical protein
MILEVQLNKTNHQSVTIRMSTELANELSISIILVSRQLCLSTNSFNQLNDVENDSSNFLNLLFEDVHNSMINQFNFKHKLNSDIATLSFMSVILHRLNEDIDLNNLNYNDLSGYCQLDRFIITKCKCANYMFIIDNILYNHKYDIIRDENHLKIKKFARLESLRRIERKAEAESEV